MSVLNRGNSATVFRGPLSRTSRAFNLLPLVVKQVVEEVIVPLGRLSGPSTFQPTGNRVVCVSGSVTVDPAKPLVLQRSAFRLGTDVLIRIGGTVSFTEGMATSDQGNGFFVVHCHTAERVTNIKRSLERIGVSVGAFWVDVDQTHLHGTERIFEFAIT